jgi:hypothetical protein
MSFKTTAEALARLTDCQLATLEILMERKRVSLSDLRRQEAIAEEALDACVQFCSFDVVAIRAGEVGYWRIKL